MQAAIHLCAATSRIFRMSMRPVPRTITLAQPSSPYKEAVSVPDRNWQAHMAPIITLFNHKGGVSKTTTAFNLGWMLARKGSRVLVVDCDPQCNLTGMILGFSHEETATSIEGGRGDAPL